MKRALSACSAAVLACAVLAGCDRSKPAVAASAPMPDAAADRCAGLPPLAEGALDLAEAAILDGGASRVVLDPFGCRVYRLAAADGGTVRLEFQLEPGRVTYAHELSAREVHDFIDREGDGIFERELVEIHDDAGWVSSSELDRDDAGLRRVRDERATRTTRRTVREVWADGGWVVTSDIVGPRKPSVVPITR
jgi:hypothetical protein